MFRTALSVAIGLGIFAAGAMLGFGCSDSDSPASSSTSSGSGAGVPTCSCTGQVSGQSFEVVCGTSQCIAGSTYTCPTAGNLVTGARCAETDDAGVASGAGCGFFSCTSQTDCAPIGTCFSSVIDGGVAGDGGAYCYPPSDGDGTPCATGESPVTKDTPDGSALVCVPASCPAPNAYVK